MIEKKEFYNLQEVAEILSLHPNTVRSWAREKRINFVKMGRSYRVYPEEIERIKREGVPERKKLSTSVNKG